jgi:hypothetical protein
MGKHSIHVFLERHIEHQPFFTRLRILLQS